MSAGAQPCYVATGMDSPSVPRNREMIGTCDKFPERGFFEKKKKLLTLRIHYSIRGETRSFHVHILMNSREKESIIEYNDVAVAFLTSKHI